VTASAGQALPNSEARRIAGRALYLDDRQFEDWALLLEQRVALFMAPERRSFLASGLRACMRETGHGDYRRYYDYMVSAAEHGEQWSSLVDRLTVHETCFFRHQPSMNLVRDVVLPAAFQQSDSVAAWSVGCATGEEAYSLAMLMDAHCSSLPHGCSYRVIGTDISAPSLRHARAGVYLNRRLDDVSEPFRQRYCQSVSSTRFSITTRLRQKVEFSPLNLRDVADAPFGSLNLIFCQNLLIYYDRPRRLQLVDYLAGFLCPQGVLVLGPGELLNWQHPSMERVRFNDTLAYRRAE
jgi:chemotaxis protein methyltransferase CheR/type IV pilus assembly protein PilK